MISYVSVVVEFYLLGGTSAEDFLPFGPLQLLLTGRSFGDFL
jgi:hypothetical protein